MERSVPRIIGMRAKLVEAIVVAHDVLVVHGYNRYAGLIPCLNVETSLWAALLTSGHWQLCRDL